MKYVLATLLCLALGFSVLASSVPIIERNDNEVDYRNTSLTGNSTNVTDPSHIAGYDLSFDYHPYSLVQVRLWRSLSCDSTELLSDLDRQGQSHHWDRYRLPVILHRMAPTW